MLLPVLAWSVLAALYGEVAVHVFSLCSFLWRFPSTAKHFGLSALGAPISEQSVTINNNTFLAIPCTEYLYKQMKIHQINID